jgi:hypothetical protein
MEIKKEITLTKEDIIEIICEKFDLDRTDATFTIKEREIGDDRFGSVDRVFDSIKIVAKQR